MRTSEPDDSTVDRCDFAWMAGLFAGICLLQTVTLSQAAFPDSDESRYLYAAKLLSQGYVPYRDFLLVQPLLVIAEAAAVFKIFGIVALPVRIVHVLITESILFPVYMLVKRETRNRLAAVCCSVLFLSFVEFQHHDSRHLALRQQASALVAWGLYFLLARKRVVSFVAGGALVGLATSCTHAEVPVITGLAVSAGILAVVCPEVRRRMLFFLGGIVAGSLPFLFNYAIPGAIHCLVYFHAGRMRVPLAERFVVLESLAVRDFLIFACAAGGLILSRSRPAVFLAIALAVAFPLTFFLPPSCYPHYVSGLAPLLAIVPAGIFGFRRVAGRPWLARALAGVVLVVGIFVQFIPKLSGALLSKQSDYYALIGEIRKRPGDLFTVEPVYAIDSGKNIPFYYYAADPRSLLVARQRIPDDDFVRVVREAQVVQLDSSSGRILSEQQINYLKTQFRIVFQNRYGIVAARLKSPLNQ